eukprot:scaffold69572_cov36-Phaeocystis_antarctica.AAC.1
MMQGFEIRIVHTVPDLPTDLPPYETQLFGWKLTDFPIDQLAERQNSSLKIFGSIPGRSNMERDETFQKMWRPNEDEKWFAASKRPLDLPTLPPDRCTS